MRVRELFSADAVRSRVAELAQQLVRDYADAPFVIVCIDRGAVRFVEALVAALTRHGARPEVCHVRARGTEGGERRGGEVEPFPPRVFEDRDVLGVDDIADEGATLRAVRELVADAEPRSLRSAVLVDRASRAASPGAPTTWASRSSAAGSWASAWTSTGATASSTSSGWWWIRGSSRAAPAFPEEDDLALRARRDPPPPRAVDPSEPPGAAERALLRDGGAAPRGPRRGGSRQRLLGRGADRRGPRLLLGPRPRGRGPAAERRGAPHVAHRDPRDGDDVGSRAEAPGDAAARDRGGERPGPRRGVLPRPRRRYPDRGRVRHVSRRGHQQRPCQHGARRELASAAPGGCVARLPSPSLGSRARRPRGGAHRARRAQRARRGAGGDLPRPRRGDLRAQPPRRGHDEEGALVEPREREPHTGHRPREPQRSEERRGG